jgi:hypothetical protein
MGSGVFPALDSMVAPGGPCAGAIVVHQEDNAGPHKEGVYTEWLQAQFDDRGWKLELQAPQGPYTNVLVSKSRHFQLTRYKQDKTQ